MSHKDGYRVVYGQIEAQTGLSRYQINSASDNLTELGWLRVERPKMPNGHFGAKIWTVMNPTSASFSTLDEFEKNEPTSASFSTVEKVTDIKNTNNKNTINPEFEIFWKIWPRKESKATAVKSWAKAIKKVSPDEIIKAATDYAKHPNNADKKFVPYAATWLNQERWQDELPKVSGKNNDWMNRSNWG